MYSNDRTCTRFNGFNSNYFSNNIGYQYGVEKEDPS